MVVRGRRGAVLRDTSNGIFLPSTFLHPASGFLSGAYRMFRGLILKRMKAITLLYEGGGNSKGH